MKYKVVTEFPSQGPVAATSTPDGSYIAIDFAHLQDPTKALRLGVPAERLEILISELQRIQKALGDPTSGIHFHGKH
jgi:hypothetical protein